MDKLTTTEMLIAEMIDRHGPQERQSLQQGKDVTTALKEMVQKGLVSKAGREYDLTETGRQMYDLG